MLKLTTYSSYYAPTLADWAANERNDEFFRHLPPVCEWNSNLLAMDQVFGNSFIILKNGMPIGICNLRYENQANSAEFGLLIDHNKGVCNQTLDVLDMLFTYCFRDKRLNRLYCRLMDHREAARDRLLDLGFTLEATLRQSCYYRGHYCNEFLLSLLSKER